MSDKKQKKGGRTGILIVTHKDYGAKLLEAAEFILGRQRGCRTIGVDASLDVEETVSRIKEYIDVLDKGGGVLVLTDMFGGTPTNLSLSLLATSNLEVITGVNLPMLLKVLGNRNKPPQELAKEAKDAGIQGIVVAGEILRKKVAGK